RLAQASALGRSRECVEPLEVLDVLIVDRTRGVEVGTGALAAELVDRCGDLGLGTGGRDLEEARDALRRALLVEHGGGRRVRVEAVLAVGVATATGAALIGRLGRPQRHLRVVPVLE